MLRRLPARRLGRRGFARAAKQPSDEEFLEVYDSWRHGKVGKVPPSALQPASADWLLASKGKVLHNTVLAACGRLHRWAKALAILRDMELFGALRPGRRGLMDKFSYNATLGACASAHQWEAALELFLEMQRSVTPDAISYSAVIEACKGARKQGVAQLASKWSEPCLQATVSEINRDRTSPRYRYAVLSTLLRRQLWSEALGIFWHVAHARPLDTALLNMAISAYQCLGPWDTLEIFSPTRRGSHRFMSIFQRV